MRIVGCNTAMREFIKSGSSNQMLTNLEFMEQRVVGKEGNWWTSVAGVEAKTRAQLGLPTVLADYGWQVGTCQLAVLALNLAWPSFS